MKRLKTEGVAVTDAMKQAGSLWSALSEDDKKPYIKAHDEDVVR